MSDGLIQAVMDEVARALVAVGVERDRAESEARAICNRIRLSWGGNDHYIPVADKAEQDRVIADDVARMQNRRKVAQLHGVSESTVTRAVMRHNRRKRRPGTGFGSPDWVL